MPELTSTFYTHSNYIKNERDDYVFVKEKKVTVDSDTNEITSTKNNLKIIPSPKKRVWITKPQFRNHKGKRETERLDHCDCYSIENRYLKEKLGELLDVKVNKYTKLKDILNSPYVYGADLDMESLVRLAYENNLKHNTIPFVKGFLDIEQSVLGDDRINAITLIIDNYIYCGYLNDFMKKKVNGIMVKADENDVIKLAHEYLGDYIDKYNFQLNVVGFDKEIDLIKWILDKAHFHEADFVGIWNMAFDIPTIIDRIEKNGCDPKDFFCDPSIAKELRRCEFIPDRNKKVAHVVEKWGWFDCTSHTQWIDLMTLFARIRKRQAKRPKYSLDAIAESEIKDKKLHVAQAGHYEMQTERFVEYVVYNIKDSLLIWLMENKNKDIDNLYKLSRSIRMHDFNKQGAMLNHSYQKFLLNKGYVLSCTGSNMNGPYDSLMRRVGGAVGNARNTREMGAFCTPQLPGYNTNIIPYVGDQDYKSFYPNTKKAGNISKETKLASIVEIEGHNFLDIENYCSAIAAPKENAVYIGNKYYGLPNYSEMDELVKEYL